MKASASVLILLALLVFIVGLIVVIGQMVTGAGSATLLLTGGGALVLSVVLWAAADALGLLGEIAAQVRLSADLTEQRLAAPPTRSKYLPRLDARDQPIPEPPLGEDI